MGLKEWLRGLGGAVLMESADGTKSFIDKLGDKIGEYPGDAQFKEEGRNSYRSSGAMAYDQYKAMDDQASGKTSVSREQLRQGLQQQYGQQRSMAAGASPN